MYPRTVMTHANSEPKDLNFCACAIRATMTLLMLTHISGGGNLRLGVCNLWSLAPRHEDWEGAASVLSKALDKAEAESGVSPSLSRVTDLIVRGAGSEPQV